MKEMTDEEVLNSGLSKSQKCEILIRNNGGLLRQEAMKFRKANVVCDEEDYEQEARLAIFEGAIDNYDPLQGKFSTYLTHCVRNAIKKQASRFYGPLTVSNKNRLIMFKIDTLLNKGYNPFDVQIILKLKKNIFDNFLFLRKLNRIDEALLDQVFEIPKGLIIEDAKLTEIESKVIDLRQTMTLRQVGKVLNFSPEWIRKVEVSAINKIKEVL